MPTEIQTEIISYLPREDLASISRACHQLHAVAEAFLYTYVELRSFDEVVAFFFPPLASSFLKSTRTRQVAIKRAQWKLIKTLDITIAPEDKERRVKRLPSELREGGPLHLDRLRLTYDKAPWSIYTLLIHFNPVELGLRRNGPAFWTGSDKWMSALAWTDVTRVTYAQDPVFCTLGSFATDVDLDLIAACTKVSEAVIVITCPWQAIILLMCQVHPLILVCPNLERIIVPQSSPGPRERTRSAGGALLPNGDGT